MGDALRRKATLRIAPTSLSPLPRLVTGFSRSPGLQAVGTTSLSPLPRLVTGFSRSPGLQAVGTTIPRSRPIRTLRLDD